MPPEAAAAADGDPYSLQGALEPTRLSWTYRAGLVVVTVAMVTLPLLYLGLIGLASWAVWWHMTANTWIMDGRGSAIGKLLVYVAPIVAGCLLVFFMVKPVFARPATRVDPVPIPPETEPRLLRFVTRICRQVRAPVPSRIQVDCQVNASASFASMFARRPQFVLTIGLPLAAGLTVRQLGGVLAHEFGHFAQGGGMRLTFIVRTINGWFARVVFERDEWDEALARWTKNSDWRISIVLLTARASIWCSRRVLYGLMLAGHAISCFMMRQMEYDADSYEIKLAGSAAFTATSARMRELNVGSQIGYHDLQEGWVRRTLPSDLPAFLLNGCSRIPAELSARLRQIPEGTTGWFDTHPADADRAGAAERAGAPGIMTGGDVPATRLFRNFDALSAAATRHHYEHDLDLNLDAATLIDTNAAVAATASRQSSQASARAFFGELASSVRPMHARLTDVASSTVPELVATLVESRRKMAAEADAGAAAYRAYEQCERKLTLARAAGTLLDAGFTKVVADGFELSEGTRQGVAEGTAFAEQEMRRLDPILSRMDDTAGARLACALALLDRDALDFDPQSRETLRQDAARFAPALAALASAWPHVQELGRLLLAARILSGNAAQSPDQAAASATLTATIDRTRALLGQIRAAVGSTPAPDDNPHRPTLAAVLGLDSTADTEQRAPAAVDAALSLRADVAGRLAGVALQVEAAIDRAGLASPAALSGSL